jgi:hypothetical protein
LALVACAYIAPWSYSYLTSDRVCATVHLEIEGLRPRPSGITCEALLSMGLFLSIQRIRCGALTTGETSCKLSCSTLTLLLATYVQYIQSYVVLINQFVKGRSCFVSIPIRLGLGYRVKRGLEDFLQRLRVLEPDAETNQVGFDTECCSPVQLRVMCQ